MIYSRQELKYLPDGSVGIALTHGKYMFVDAEDVELLSKNLWSAYKSRGLWRVQAVINGKTTKPHRLLLNVTDPKVQVDHKDNNPLNNRKCNLRVCSNAENNRNVRPRNNCKSVYKGVQFNNKTKKWFSNIMVNYKRIRIGTFKTEIEAAKAYDEAAKKYHKTFAYLNFN